MLITEILYCGKNVKAVCDLNCDKAWGINLRPRVELSKNPDDYYWKMDNELGIAPKDTGSQEGGHGKPYKPTEHNKWCVRECERCMTFGLTEQIKLKDFNKRIYNIEPKE